MSQRRNLYVAGFVAASLSYTLDVIAFTGELNLFRWVVFAAFFLPVFVRFEWVVGWAETLDS
jgi:hypothetical protein